MNTLQHCHCHYLLWDTIISCLIYCNSLLIGLRAFTVLLLVVFFSKHNIEWITKIKSCYSFTQNGYHLIHIKFWVFVRLRKTFTPLFQLLHPVTLPTPILVFVLDVLFIVHPLSSLLDFVKMSHFQWSLYNITLLLPILTPHHNTTKHCSVFLLLPFL